MKLLKSGNYKLYLWGTSCLTLLVSAISQHTSFGVYGIFASILTTAFIYIFFSSGKSVEKLKLPFIIAIGIFLYTVFTSLYLARSTLISANIICAVFFFYTLLDLEKVNQRSSRERNNQASFNFKIILSIVISTHCAILIYQYGINPIRVTGLLKDYSQASFCILLCFGLIYPILMKRKKISVFVIFIFFLAFFTPFSRTSNLLLFIFLVFIFLWEYKKGDIKNLFIPLIAIISALAIIYLYPILIDMPVVQRGGFNSEQLATLNSRTRYWTTAWEAIWRRPITGHGLGSFEWSGIKLYIPFQYIPSVHNDYLQIWLDLGAFWFIGLVAAQLYFLLRYCPFEIISIIKVTIKEKVNQQHYIAWVLLFCTSLYMCINFIVSFLFFQLIIAFLFAEIIYNESNEKA